MTETRVTAAGMRQTLDQMKHTNHETYKIILGRIQEEIRLYTAKHVTSMVARIPGYVMNRPLYNPKSAAWYVSLSLRRDGFATSVVLDPAGEYYVRVSWEPAPKKVRHAQRAADATREKFEAVERQDLDQRRQVQSAAQAAQSLDLLKAKLRHFIR
jgi:hypothetical protein